MSQRLRSLIEYELRETHSDNTQRATNIRVRLAVELLLDLRDTANAILAEMKDKDRSCDLAVNNGTGDISYHDFNIENSGSCYCNGKEKRGRLVRN